MTSAQFDEPKAIQILSGSRFGVSIHGFKEETIEAVEIGGANLELSMAIFSVMKSLGVETRFPSVRFPAKHSENIVNKAKQGGVQLEISSKLRKNLLNNPTRLVEFGARIRQAVEGWLKSSSEVN